MNSIKKDYRISLGFTLCLLGVSLGNFLRVLIGVNLVQLFMVVSALCLVDLKNLFRFRFPNMSRGIFLLLLSQIIIVIYMFFSNVRQSNITQNVFMYYSLLLVVIVASLPKLHLKKLVTVYYVFATLNVLMASFLFFNGFGGMIEGNVDKDYLESMETTGKAMVFLFPSAGVYHTMATLALLKQTKISNKIFRYLIIGFLFVDFILIISSGKRTVVLLYVLYILYYLWNERKFSSIRNFVKFIPTILIVVFLIKFALPNLPFITDFIDAFWDKLTRGIDTLFGLDKSNYDESAGVRVAIRNYVYKIYQTKFSIINYLFGYGYMTLYMDQPLLQCFFDMGLVGIFVYIYNVLYVPVKQLLKKTNDSNFFLFKLNCLASVLTCLTAGTPYGYMMYCPVLFMLYAYNTRNYVSK